MQLDLLQPHPYEPASQIAGLDYIADYMTEAQEVKLISLIDQQPWLTDLKRRVQYYGWKYDYKARGITHDLQLGPIPDWLAGYCERLTSGEVFKRPPEQVIINEYMPGQGIAQHIDCVPCFGEAIASLSLGSPCVMEFSKDNEKIPMLLEPRSLVVFSGDARYRWKHAIAQRKTDKIDGVVMTRSRRLSLTFRTVVIDEV